MSIDIENAITGTIVVWGDNSLGQIKDAPPGSDFAHLARGGAGQSLALRADGSLWLWGGTKMGAPVPPIPSTMAPIRFVELAISLTYWIGLTNSGSIMSDGKFLSGAAMATPAGTGYKAIAAGANHGVAIDSGGNLIGWGAIGACPAGTFTKVAARSGYAIAIRQSDGALVGWGLDPAWGLRVFGRWGWTAEGAGSGHYSVKGPFKDLAAGVVQKPPMGDFPHVVALLTDATIQGWGDNKFGEAPPMPTGKNITAIGAGLGYTIGLHGPGNLRYWGAPPGVLPLKDGSTAIGKLPTGLFLSISAGSNHATALRMTLAPGPDARPRKLPGRKVPIAGRARGK